MPRYFFHLSFGNRTCRDEEGFELPGRAAARAEAFAVLRDLGHGRGEENGRSWAGWFLQVADAEGEFFSLPIDQPLLATAGGPRAKSTRSPLKGRLADLTQRMLGLRQRTTDLMQENRQLRDALASEFRRGAQLKAAANELLASTRLVRLEAAGITDLRTAIAPPRRSRPHLVVLQGGGSFRKS